MQDPCNKIAMAVLLLMISAAAGEATGTRLHFLDHGPSAAIYGRGETGTSAANADAPAAFYNPSLIAPLQMPSVAFSHYPLLDGSMYNYIGGSWPLTVVGRQGNIGFSAINLRSGDVEVRQHLEDAPVTTNASQWAYTISAAVPFEKPFPFALGANLKYVYYNMFDHTAGGFGADLGAARTFDGPKLFGNQSRVDIGLSARNILSPEITLSEEAEQLDPSYHVGADITLPLIYRYISNDSIGLYAESYAKEDHWNYAFGAEYMFFYRYVLRSGYYDRHITLGAGYRYNDISFDYAADFSEFSLLHRFGIGYSWRARQSVKAKSMPASDDDLMQEARRVLRETLKDRNRKEKEVQPAFRKSLKEYRKRYYLTAADGFREIMMRYPEYENAEIFYGKITTEMNAASQSLDDPNFERICYARGYLAFREQRYGDALNEWEKVLAINDQRDELRSYVEELKRYLKDERKKKWELEQQEKAKRLYDAGVEEYSSRKWVRCVRAMEKLKEFCAANQFSTALEWRNRADEYIQRSLKELSKIAFKPAPVIEEKAVKEREIEIDAAGAERKYREGLYLYAQGKIEDALRQWEIAVRLDPGHVKAAKAIQKANEELGVKR